MSNKGARKGERVARSWREKGRSDRFKNNLAGMARNSRRRRGKNKAELNVPREENIWRVRFFFFFFVEIRWTFDSWTLVDSKTRRYWPDVNRERIDDVFRIRNYPSFIAYPCLRGIPPLRKVYRSRGNFLVELITRDTFCDR